MNVQMSDLADSLLRILSGTGTKARQPKMQSRETSGLSPLQASSGVHSSESVCRRHVVGEVHVLQGFPPVGVG